MDKISFTGSTAVGQHVMKTAADTVKRVTLELGGKSPNIIFADADIAAAVKGAQNGIFYSKGEVCAAGSRLVVEKSVHDQVVSELAARAKKLVPGDPMDKQSRIGAVVSKKQQQSVLSYIEKGKSEGATLVAGGKDQSMYGLAAGIWTRDISKAHRVARAVKAGTVWINTYNFYDAAAPFGGYKASGFGRDLGKEALEGYLETKTVWVAL